MEQPDATYTKIKSKLIFPFGLGSSILGVALSIAR